MITFSEPQQKIVDVLRVVNHAHWIEYNNDIIYCSYCHTWFYKDCRYPYMRHCPYCGIDMTESEVQDADSN